MKKLMVAGSGIEPLTSGLGVPRSNLVASPTSKKNLLITRVSLYVIETKACNASTRLHRLPLTFTLSFQLEILTKAN